MRAVSRSLVVALAALTPAVPASAQRLRIDIAPSAGVIRPLDAAGAVTSVEQAWYLDLERADAAPFIGVTADVGRPRGWFGVRVTAHAALPATAHASFRCRPGLACPAVLLESGADVSSLAGFVDLVLSPVRSDRIEAWIAAGPGLQRTDVRWQAPAVLVGAGEHAGTVPALHAATGFDIRIGNGALRTGIGMLWRPEGDAILPADASTGGTVRAVRRPAGTDLLLSLGWSLLRF